MIGDKTDDEGQQINVEVSYPLFICSVVFGVIANSILIAVGIYGAKTMNKSVEALKKIEVFGNDYSILEMR